MKQRMLLAVPVFLALSLASWGVALAQPAANGAGKSGKQSFTGVVSDTHCGAKHSTASEAAATCVKHCVSGGASYALVSHGKVYQLSDQSKFEDLAGQKVRVRGTLNGDTIEVASVHPLKNKNSSM